MPQTDKIWAPAKSNIVRAMTDLAKFTQQTVAHLCEPFEWCLVNGGQVVLEDAADRGGTSGGVFATDDFLISKYLVTNDQYSKFVTHENGYQNVQWWAYSPEAMKWREVRKKEQETAFAGFDLPRTRVSWYESMAFCAWLSSLLQGEVNVEAVDSWAVRLPKELEWQRAAVGDSGTQYPWGSEPLTKARANYNNQVGKPTSVTAYPTGASPYGAMDMIGNALQWCITAWGSNENDISGYKTRNVRGGAWNVIDESWLTATDRGGHPPRGRLNDVGFRLTCVLPRLV